MSTYFLTDKGQIYYISLSPNWTFVHNKMNPTHCVLYQCMYVLKKSITFVKNTFLKRALTYNTKLKLSFNFMWRSSIYLYCIHIYSTYSIHTRSLRGATRLEFLWNWPRFFYERGCGIFHCWHTYHCCHATSLSLNCLSTTYYTVYTRCRKFFLPW